MILDYLARYLRPEHRSRGATLRVLRAHSNGTTQIINYQQPMRGRSGNELPTCPCLFWKNSFPWNEPG